jgi:hypothetical protein
MKKHHSPGGMRISLRMALYAIAFIAVLGTRETLTDGTGPVSRQLGVIFNEALMAGSKLALGVALMTHDQDSDDSMSGKASMMLGKAGHRAFVSASMVNIYAN